MKTKHLFLLATLALTLFSCEYPYETQWDDCIVDFSYSINERTITVKSECVCPWEFENYAWDFGDGKVVNEVDNVKDSSFEHELNALLPRFVTLSGIVNETKLVQLLNAESPIILNLLLASYVTLVSPEQLVNAELSIDSIFFGI